MVLVELVDQHFLQHVIREADHLQGLRVAQVQGGDLAFRDPFLGGLSGLTLEDLQAFLNYLLRIFCRSHLNKYTGCRSLYLHLLTVVLVSRAVFCKFLQVLDVDLVAELEAEVLIEGFVVLSKGDDVVAL